MPCKHYKDALIEAAVTKSQPQGELRAHLDACAACRSAFEQEQSLFASIDAGLSVTANAEMPASLLPRVRARLGEAAAPRRMWATNWLVVASAAVMVVAFFAARAIWHPNIVQMPIEMARITSPLTPQNHSNAVPPLVEKKSEAPRQLVIARNFPEHGTILKGKTTPEVLVPRDQEVLLAEYAEQWSLHKHPLLLAQQFDATILSPLQVEPIQIEELGVKPLGEEKLQ